VSRLLLIRHGQASFGAADYDVLSELGLEQSRRLGEHLAATGTNIDAVYRGPRRRHVATAEAMRAAAADGGLELPDETVIDELDEYPAFELLRYWTPRLQRDYGELAAELAAGSARAMELIVQMWALGELETGELESFAAFDARVSAAVERIRAEQGRKKTVAVVTSGGPVAVAVGRCLELTPEKTIAIAWVLVNSSITELRYTSDTLGLVALNRVPHLPEPTLHTRR
jgi:broad specificity phosphatase PhoE